MSFAIFKTGGKQYKVQASEILKIEKLELSKDNKIEFNEILAYGDKKNVELGFPLIKGAKIEAELIKNSKERTVLVFKKRRRKNSKSTQGHRQYLTVLQIESIISSGKKSIALKKEIKVKKVDTKSKTLEKEESKKIEKKIEKKAAPKKKVAKKTTTKIIIKKKSKSKK